VGTESLNFINPVCNGIADSDVIATPYFSVAFSKKNEKFTQNPKTIKVSGHRLKAAIPIPVNLTVMSHRWNSQ